METPEEHDLPLYSSQRPRLYSGTSATTSIPHTVLENAPARQALETVQKLHTRVHDVSNDNSRLDETNAKLQRQLREQINKYAEMQGWLNSAQTDLRLTEQRFADYRKQTQLQLDKQQEQMMELQSLQVWKLHSGVTTQICDNSK